MNKKKPILIGYCIAITLAVLYVPWKIVGKYSVKIHSGYDFFFSLPKRGRAGAIIDFEILAIEIIAITAITVIIYLFVKDKKSENQASLESEKSTISSLPLSIVLMVFGLKIGNNIAKLIGFSTPRGAFFTIAVMVIIFGSLGWFIGSILTDYINNKNISRKLKITFACSVSIVGFLIFALLLGVTDDIITSKKVIPKKIVLDFEDPFIDKKPAPTPKQQSFINTLTALVPDWRKVIKDPQFVQYLLEVDSTTGKIRYDLAKEAQYNLDAISLAYFYQSYKAEKIKK